MRKLHSTLPSCNFDSEAFMQPGQFQRLSPIRLLTSSFQKITIRPLRLINTRYGAINCWAGWLGVRVPAEAGNFSLHHCSSRPALEPIQPPIYWVPEGAISLGVKRLGREVGHSPPSSAEVKNAWSYTSTPQHAFMAWCSVKAQGQLYFEGVAVSTIILLRPSILEQ
jgi:hypothetical protein